MNLNGIKFTINFSNLQTEKNEFYQFLETLNIEKGFNNNNKKNIKFIKYKLKDNRYYNNNFESINIDSTIFLNINVYKLGPDILSVKETNKNYLTLNFQNIYHQMKLKDDFTLKSVLSNEPFNKLLNRIFLDNETIIKKRFDILIRICLYLKEKNLHTKSAIKHIDFVDYNYNNDFIKIFNTTKKTFSNSDTTYNIRNYYFDYICIFKSKEDYIKEYNKLKDIFEYDKVKVEKCDSNDKIKFITSDENIFKEKFEIDKKRYSFKPIIDKESSYIQIDYKTNANLKFKCMGKKYLKLEQEPFQIIKVKVSGWFTKNKKILEQKNETNRYKYKLSDNFEEIIEHINSFLKKYSIYKIENNENLESSNYENINNEEYNYEDEEYDPFANPNYEEYKDEDIFSNQNFNTKEDTPDLTEQFLEDLKNSENKRNKKEEINIYDFIKSEDKKSKPLIKRFEKNEKVTVLEYSKAFENLNKIFTKFK